MCTIIISLMLALLHFLKSSECCLNAVVIMKLALFCLIQVQCLAADDGKKSGGRRVGMGSMGKCIVYSSRKSALFAQSHGIQR